MQKQKIQAFTLVELIVVITILAILGTIAFISLQGYSSTARNSKRVSDIVNVSKGLEIKKIKSGFYEFPENYETFTGTLTKTLKQGILGNKVLTNIGVTTNVKDPLTEDDYTYSVYGNGEYYQIAYELEENIFSSNIKIINNLTAEETNKEVKIKGNYEIDPSLPSLIVIPETVTGSGIFDPEVCFILEGGENTFESTSIDCQKKKEMSLKEFDEGLVGYWDMETLTGTLLKDLSGNENNGSFEGGMTYNSSLIGGFLGKGMNFTNSGYSIQIPDTLTGSILDLESFSVSTVIYYSGVYQPNIGPIFVSKGIYDNYNFKLAFSPEDYIGGQFSPKGYWYHVLHTYDGNCGLLVYVNGKLVKKFTLNNCFLTSNYPIIFGKYILNNPYSLNGIIDEVKIYNRILSEQEIKQQAKIAGF